MSFHLDDIFSTAEPFVSKLGMLIHYHGPECYMKRLVYYFQGQVDSDGSYTQMLQIRYLVSFLFLLEF